MRIVFLILLLFSCLRNYAQGDMLILKKHNHSIKTFFKGSVASFITTSGQYVTTQIHDIRNDSIFYKELMVRQVLNQWGVTSLDTVANILRGLHYSEIAAIPKPRKFTQVSIAGLLIAGGAGYLALNLINSVYHRYPPFAQDNLKHILPAAGALATGIVARKLSKPNYELGKKYTLHYIRLGNK